MRGVLGAGQRLHAHLEREAEDHLRRRPPQAPDNLRERGRAQMRDVRGEQGEALVDDAALAAEGADLGVPAVPGEAAVLHEGRRCRRALAEKLELVEIHIAHADEARLARRVERFHGGPDREVGHVEPDAARGPVQHVGVDALHAQMLQRAGEGLAHLGRVVRAGVIGQPVILAAHRRELGLDEELVARHEAVGDGGLDGRAHPRLVVVAPLIGGVDATEARLQREPRQPRRLQLLPGRAVDEARHLNARDGESMGCHRRIIGDPSPALQAPLGLWSNQGPCISAPSLPATRATVRSTSPWSSSATGSPMRR